MKKKIESFEPVIIEDCSTFDIDINNLVSAQTAKEMTKIELNAHQWHRKFDGQLEKIKIKFKDDDDNESKMIKIFNKLGYGQIENYISDEDIDSCDLTDGSGDDEDEDEDEEEHDDDDSDSNDDDSSSDQETSVEKSSINEKNKKTEKAVTIPSSIKKKKK